MISLDPSPAPLVRERTMGAHCFVCKARFRIPCSPTSPVRCPDCGSGQVIDHNLGPVTPVKESEVVA